VLENPDGSGGTDMQSSTTPNFTTHSASFQARGIENQKRGKMINSPSSLPTPRMQSSMAKGTQSTGTGTGIGSGLSSYSLRINGGSYPKLSVDTYSVQKSRVNYNFRVNLNSVIGKAKIENIRYVKEFTKVIDEQTFKSRMVELETEAQKGYMRLHSILLSLPVIGLLAAYLYIHSSTTIFQNDPGLQVPFFVGVSAMAVFVYVIKHFRNTRMKKGLAKLLKDYTNTDRHKLEWRLGKSSGFLSTTIWIKIGAAEIETGSHQELSMSINSLASQVSSAPKRF
jgi:hypothetical protein